MQTTDDEENGETDDMFDRERARNYLAFVRGSVRRHRRLVVAVLASIMGLTIASIVALPRSYHVESKLFAQRSQVLAVRGDGPDAVAPTRGAVETVLRRDNLVALIQATDLVRHWHDHRAPAQRLADAVLLLFHADDSAQDRIDTMVERLEKRLAVWTNDGTVTITVDWPDARMACRIVDTAQQSFLEVRYAQEITALSESIIIVRSHAGSLMTNIDEAVAAVERLRADRPQTSATMPAAAQTGVRPPLPRLSASAEPRPEVAQLKLTVDAKQRVIDDLEEARRRRLSEIQTRLIEQQATYTENHPVIADLRHTVTALSTPSPQVKSLTQEVGALRAEYVKKSEASPDPYASAPGPAPATGSLTGAAAPPPLPTEILRLDQELREDRDPATVYARGQLRDAMEKYAALRAQIQAAQIDLETAQAAFKYRYSVLKPALLPRSATKPNVPLIVLAALVAALLSAVFIAVLSDVRSGKVVERWQIEQLLDRPILGEMVLPQLPRHDAE